MSVKKNIFVLALDEFNLKHLKNIHNADQYHFHSLLDFKEVIHAVDYDVNDLLNKARKQLDKFDGKIDAIINHWDFPSSMIAPILSKEYGLRSASIESVLKCEHKYWSRIEQKKVVPDNVPAFCKVNPFDDNALEKISLDYPFWLKPVKAFSSLLGFKIKDEKDFKKAINKIREQISFFGTPLKELMKYAEVPDSIFEESEYQCIAEELISGEQLAPEGYMQNGEVTIHGMIDLVRAENNISFNRFEYPSNMPSEIQQEAINTTKKLIKHLNLNDHCFNVEYLWNEELQKLWLIEVNTRISKSHSALFEMVDGVSNHEVSVNVALGQRPKLIQAQGKFHHAAEFMYRVFEDGIVKKVPSEKDLKRLKSLYPDVHVVVKVDENMKLSDLTFQDPYSYVLAHLIIGANSHEQLMEKYYKCLEVLPFQIESVEEKEVYKPRPTGGARA